MKNQVRRAVLVSTTAFCIEAGSTTASAQVCVDPAGGGCETTIQAGVDLATAGQTVSVAAATYSEAVTIPAGKDGLVIEAKGAILDNPSALDGIVVLSNDVAISGLTIRNGNRGVVIGEEDVLDVTNISLSRMRFESQFDSALFIPGSDLVRIEKCSFGSCGDYCVKAGNADPSDGVSVSKSSFLFCDRGCVRIDGTNASIVKNKCEGSEDEQCFRIFGNNGVIEKNKGYNAAGLAEVYGENLRVVKNRVRSYGETAFDIGCTGNCDAGATVSGNRARDTADDNRAFFIQGDAPGLVVSDNDSQFSADDGFLIQGVGVVVTGNSSIGSGGDQSESGFEIYGSDHVFTENFASKNANDGFRLGFGTNITFTNNVAVGNYGDGFDVGPVSTGIVLTGNVATGNTGEGFALDAMGDPDPITATLTNNTSTGNRTPFCVSVTAGGPTDGGGNSFTVPGAPACEVDH